MLLWKREALGRRDRRFCLGQVECEVFQGQPEMEILNGHFKRWVQRRSREMEQKDSFVQCGGRGKPWENIRGQSLLFGITYFSG